MRNTAQVNRYGYPSLNALMAVKRICTPCTSGAMGLQRPERAIRFKPLQLVEAPSYAEHVNAIGMVCSLLGLLMRVGGRPAGGE